MASDMEMGKSSVGIPEALGAPRGRETGPSTIGTSSDDDAPNARIPETSTKDYKEFYHGSASSKDPQAQSLGTSSKMFSMQSPGKRDERSRSPSGQAESPMSPVPRKPPTYVVVAEQTGPEIEVNDKESLQKVSNEIERFVRQEGQTRMWATDVHETLEDNINKLNKLKTRILNEAAKQNKIQKLTTDVYNAQQHTSQRVAELEKMVGKLLSMNVESVNAARDYGQIGNLPSAIGTGSVDISDTVKVYGDHERRLLQVEEAGKKVFNRLQEYTVNLEGDISKAAERLQTIEKDLYSYNIPDFFF